MRRATLSLQSKELSDAMSWNRQCSLETLAGTGRALDV